MEQTTKFWDRIAERYSRQPIADEAAYQKKLQVTREVFKPDMTVLEFGCGTGSTALVHAPYVKQIHAIDFSANMIAIARRKASEAGINNVTFEQNSIEALAPEQAYDAVLGLSVLHLLNDKEAVIQKVWQLLKPGGVFISSTACLGDSAFKYFKYIEPLARRLGLMPRVQVFDREELQQCLIDAGFRLEYQWQPARNKALFLVARKPDSEGGRQPL
mgnify:CR=1 FL=1